MEERYADLLATRGVSLEIVGLKDFALRREDAFDAIKILREYAVPILGGDVFFQRDGSVELAYCNWYSDRSETESAKEYLERSLSVTQSYIERFPSTVGTIPLFRIVTLDR